MKTFFDFFFPSRRERIFAWIVVIVWLIGMIAAVVANLDSGPRPPLRSPTELGAAASTHRVVS